MTTEEANRVRVETLREAAKMVLAMNPRCLPCITIAAKLEEQADLIEGGEH